MGERYLAERRQGDSLLFDGGALAHFSRVRRGKIGERVEAVLLGRLYEVEITECRDRLAGKIVREIENLSELRAELWIAFPLLRGNRHELIVQKGTELGAEGFWPYECHRSVALCPKGKEEEKRSRLRKIAENSLEQCKRLHVPEVLPISKFEDLAKAEGYDRRIFAYEALAGSPSASLIDALKDLKAGEKVLYAIGPEGGYEESEAKALASSGFASVSLGSRILRAETAAIYGASIFSALAEAI